MRLGSRPLLAASSGAAPPLRGVNFISVCGFSHRGTDDPIVLPRQPGFSHDHTFIGNTSTDAFSTPAQLRAAGTTCKRTADKAAYWTPTLLRRRRRGRADDGRSPTTGGTRPRPLKPFPAGLQMVAGNSKATAPQRLTVTWWDCGELVDVPHTATAPQCQDGNLSLHVNFPDCWDGKTLCYDNQKNTAYSRERPLPEGLPRGDAGALAARQLPA